MFTGIIEELGTIVSVERREGLQTFAIGGDQVAADMEPSRSMSVNGVCVTAVATDEGGFTFEAMPETLRRTNLGALEPGDRVNLERPLAANGRLDGHIVQGHVDGTATITGISQDGESLLFDLETTPEVARYIVEKGFLALDGASLTVTYCEGNRFGVALIPYTIEHILMGTAVVGDRVNVEVDLLAKYAEKMLAAQFEATGKR
jgi:riboflavin synthase